MEKIEITQEELQRSFEQLEDLSIDKLRYYINQAKCWSKGDFTFRVASTPLHHTLHRLYSALTKEAMRREVVKRERNKEH